MTKLLYLRDCYQKESTAKVVAVCEHDGNVLVELDRTIFYPTGGGQPDDKGTFTCGDVVYEVTDVYKFKDKVFHVVDKVGLKAGDDVLCKIDWERRYRHMRMHTAAHLISDLIERDANTKVSGNQLGLDKSRIDFTLEDFDREFLQFFEGKANELIEKGAPIKKFFASREEAEKIPGVFTLLKGFAHDIDTIRLVDIDGVKISACGGTHLDNLTEIKGVKFLKFENKGKQRRRIVFTLTD